MYFNQLREQAAHPVIDRKKHGLSRKGHTWMSGGEMQPVVAGSHGTDTVKNGVCWNQDGIFRFQWNVLPSKDKMAARLGIVVEAPEG
jgi:hypothetical protein